MLYDKLNIYRGEGEHQILQKKRKGTKMEIKLKKPWCIEDYQFKWQNDLVRGH